MTKLAIGGFKGRMGQRIIALAGDDPRFEIAAEYDLSGATQQHPFDVLIDFSSPEGTMKFLAMCKEKRAGLIIGSTGHGEDQLAQIKETSSEIAILKTANFSIGINLLLNVLPGVARELSSDFDIEIVETHHTRKVDAPSGTAIALLDSILAAKQADGNRVVYGRRGEVGAKPSDEIGIHAVRSGEVIGKHEVIFGGVGESITILHEAHSRDTFAKGALEAAAWIHGQAPGYYNMQNVLRDRT